MINFGPLEFSGKSTPYPVVLYTKINSGGQSNPQKSLKLRITYQVLAQSKKDEELKKSALIVQESAQKEISIYCPKLDVPCEDVILENILPKYDSDLRY